MNISTPSLAVTAASRMPVTSREGENAPRKIMSFPSKLLNPLLRTRKVSFQRTSPAWQPARGSVSET